MGTRFEAAGSILDALLPHPCGCVDDATITTTSIHTNTTSTIMNTTAAACVNVAAADVRRGVWGVTSSQPPAPPAAAATTAPAGATACVVAGLAPLRVAPAAAAAVAMDVSIVDPVCDEVLDDDDIMGGACVVVGVGEAVCGGGGSGPYNTHAHTQVDTAAHTADTRVCSGGESQLGLFRQDSQGSVRAGATSSSSNRADSSSRSGCTTTTSTVHRLQPPTHTYRTPPHTHAASYYVPSHMQQSSTPASELRLYRRAALWKGTVCGKSVSDLTMLDFSTYGQDRMEAMRSRERDYAAAPTYAEKHTELPPDFRTSTLAWMMEVCAQFRYRRRTYQLAVNLFERYLSLKRVVNFPVAKLKLLAATSLFIAAKIEELAKQSATTFASAAEGACSATDIRSFETQVLEALKWIANTPTLDEWVGCYILQLLKILRRSAAPTTTHTHAHTHTHDLSLPLDVLFDIVDLAIFDEWVCLHFFPRQIAAAALYLVTPRHMHGVLAACTGQSPGQRDMDCLIGYLGFIAEGMQSYQARVRYSAWDTGLQTDNRALLAQLYRRQEAFQTLQYNPLSVYMEESITYAGELTEDDDDVSVLDDNGFFAGRSFEQEVHHHHKHHQHAAKHAPSHPQHPHGHSHHQQHQQRQVFGGSGGVACRLEFGRWKLLQRGGGDEEEEEERASLLSDGSLLSADERESLLSDDPLLSTHACKGSWIGDDDATEHERDSLLDQDDDDVESEEASLPGSFSESEPDSESEDGECESGCGSVSDARAVCGGAGEGLECLEDTDGCTQDTQWSFDSVDTTRTRVQEAMVACGLSPPAHTHTYTHAHTQNQRHMHGDDSPCSVASDATSMSSLPFSGARVGGGGGGVRVRGGGVGVESGESKKLRAATDTQSSAEGLRILSHDDGGGRDNGGMSVDVPSTVYPHHHQHTTTTGPLTWQSSASASLMSPYGFLPSPSSPLLLSSSLSTSSMATIAPPSTAPGAAIPTHTHTAVHNHTAAHTHSMSAYTHRGVSLGMCDTHAHVAPSADGHTHTRTHTLKRSLPMTGSWSASPRTRARCMSSSQG